MEEIFIFLIASLIVPLYPILYKVGDRLARVEENTKSCKNRLDRQNGIITKILERGGAGR